jgi:hypothetical protein
VKNEFDINTEIARLDKLRLQEISNRENAKTEMEHNVAHNLVLVYAMQIQKLEWVIE